jgi:hypothetical protein
VSLGRSAAPAPERTSGLSPSHPNLLIFFCVGADRRLQTFVDLKCGNLIDITSDPTHAMNPKSIAHLRR